MNLKGIMNLWNLQAAPRPAGHTRQTAPDWMVHGKPVLSDPPQESSGGSVLFKIYTKQIYSFTSEVFF